MLENNQQRESRVVLWLQGLARRENPSMFIDTVGTIFCYLGASAAIALLISIVRMHFSMWYYVTTLCVMVTISAFLYGYNYAALSTEDQQSLNKRMTLPVFILIFAPGMTLSQFLQKSILVHTRLGFIAVFLIPVFYMLLGAVIPLWLGDRLCRSKLHRSE